MKRIHKILLSGYCLWVLLNLAITVFHIGDAGVGAHLALLTTGIPISLISLYLAPHASLWGVVLAGGLGLLQWFVIVKFFSNAKQ